MLATPAKAWLTGFAALLGLLVAAAGLLGAAPPTRPLTVSELERQRALDLERLCAGIVSSEALEDCRLMAAPMSGDGKGHLVGLPEVPHRPGGRS